MKGTVAVAGVCVRHRLAVSVAAKLDVIRRPRSGVAKAFLAADPTWRNLTFGCSATAEEDGQSGGYHDDAS